MNCQLAIFDMDGTILDTLRDLYTSMNYALEQFFMPRRSLDEIREFVGDGLLRLAQRSVPAGTPEAVTDEVLSVLTAHYKIHCTDCTRPYAGIPELLAGLKRRGIRTAVVSNKADFAVQELSRQYFGDLLDFSVGEREDVKRKPAPDAVWASLDAFAVKAADAVYIGDSDIDIQTAENAGLSCISVTWGFRSEDFLRQHGAKTLVSEPSEILSLLIGHQT